MLTADGSENQQESGPMGPSTPAVGHTNSLTNTTEPYPRGNLSINLKFKYVMLDDVM